MNNTETIPGRETIPDAPETGLLIRSCDYDCTREPGRGEALALAVLAKLPCHSLLILTLLILTIAGAGYVMGWAQASAQGWAR